ncbi:MAG TPA: glycosyltransferase family 2 protein [Verrucomicrobiota bacterium]|nr:glycosyltransferase family 2 protein [Verrucomicrobiota bacterium]
MPCLNEAETLAACIQKARLGLERAGVRGEILVADNGSTDGSVALAEKLGARVVHVKEKGYGSALRGGIEAARGKWIIMGDADDSYDFSRIEGFVQKFREQYDLVMGCRLPSGGGTIQPGAMPWKNRWLGNPVLSLIGRVFFKCPARDFHCGLRGFTREAYQKMELKTTGMEFASEMVIKATLKSLRIAEVPITLHPDGRSRPPHLKPWRDGWRHLRFMLIYSPRWLFLVPGLVLSVLGGGVGAVLALMPIHLGHIELSIGTLAVAGASVVIGVQLVAFAFFSKVFAIGEGLLPQDPKLSRMFKAFTLEKGICLGLVILAAGLGLLLHAVWIWKQAGYGELSYGENMRRLIPAVTLIMVAVQICFSSFFLSVLGLKTDTRQPPKI